MAIVTIRLKQYRKNASPAEKAIIDYILKNPKQTSKLTIHRLAEKTFTSASSIVRLCKKMVILDIKNFQKI